MAKQHMESDKTFYVTKAIIDAPDLEEDDPEVNRIEASLEESNAELHLYPRKPVQSTKKINGKHVKSDEEVKPRVTDLPKWADQLLEHAGNLPEEEVIKVEANAQVNKFDDGNTVYRVFNNIINSDSFSISVEEREVEESSEPEKAEEDEDLLFGEDDEE